MKKIKVKTPAKINLTLKVGKKRSDGFHSIESIMAAINLFDYLDIRVSEGHGYTGVKSGMTKINISSNSHEIPHDSSNIAYKAAELFFENCPNVSADEVDIYIEKNIPVCAGLAGGSTNASGVFFGLNKIFNNPLSYEKINALLQKLGSDLNFCMQGGRKLCKGRGEILEQLEFLDTSVTLIKPRNLKISAREAYQRFDEMPDVSELPNDLEAALLPCYDEIRFLHDLGFQMSGSGPVFFVLKPFLEASIKEQLNENYLIIENLKTIEYGVVEVN